LLALAGAALGSEIWGNVEGVGAVTGAEIGAAVGLIAGFAAGAWLVLRKGGHHAGVILAFSWVAVTIVGVCFAFVAFA
jgi:hypothetical protein